MLKALNTFLDKDGLTQPESCLGVTKGQFLWHRDSVLPVSPPTVNSQGSQWKITSFGGHTTRSEGRLVEQGEDYGKETRSERGQVWKVKKQQPRVCVQMID